MPGQTTRQAPQISVQQFLQVRRIIFQPVMLKQISNDGPIGAAAVWHPDLHLDSELLRQGRLDGRLPSSAAGQQRAVDIEKTNVHLEIIVSARAQERGSALRAPALHRYQGVMPPLTHKVWPVIN